MKKSIIILFAVITIGLVGCEKWLDVNKNPNTATVSTPDLVLPGVLAGLGSNVTGFVENAMLWMGYWSNAGGWSGWYSQKKYEVTTAFYPTAFNNYYSGPLGDTKWIRANCGVNKLFPAITEVADAWYYARLVDLYGDVPFNEALQPATLLTPKYDDDAAIYDSLIKRLDRAINVFKTIEANPSLSTTPEYKFTNSSDVVNGGNWTKWKKYANSMKLRLVMRMTNVKSASALKALMDNTVAEGFIDADITVSPGYLQSSGKMNPTWTTFGQSFNAVNTNTNTQYILNKYFHEKLKYMSDPRLSKLFFAPKGATPAGTLVSITFGTEGSLTVQPSTTVGANYSWVTMADDWVIETLSNGVIQNKGNGAAKRMPLFLLSEAKFLHAEALLKGIITTGDIATIYSDGIKASLTAAKVSTTDQTTYLANTIVAWEDGALPEYKLERIITQKWIANYLYNPFESYCDYRRTNLPNPKKATNVYTTNFEMLSYYTSGIIRRQIPRIYPYPDSEFNLNKTNVEAAVKKQNVEFITSKYPFDARVFWDNAPLTIIY